MLRSKLLRTTISSSFPLHASDACPAVGAAMRSRYKPVHLHLGSLINRELSATAAEPLPQQWLDLLQSIDARIAERAAQ